MLVLQSQYISVHHSSLVWQWRECHMESWHCKHVARLFLLVVDCRFNDWVCSFYFEEKRWILQSGLSSRICHEYCQYVFDIHLPTLINSSFALNPQTSWVPPLLENCIQLITCNCPHYCCHNVIGGLWICMNAWMFIFCYTRRVNADESVSLIKHLHFELSLNLKIS